MISNSKEDFLKYYAFQYMTNLSLPWNMTLEMRGHEVYRYGKEYIVYHNHPNSLTLWNTVRFLNTTCSLSWWFGSQPSGPRETGSMKSTGVFPSAIETGSTVLKKKLEMFKRLWPTNNARLRTTTEGNWYLKNSGHLKVVHFKLFDFENEESLIEKYYLYIHQ